MAGSAPLSSQRFPRTSAYNPDWLTAGLSGGANSLWLTEWLSEVLDLRPGMRVLDLGCGRGHSSIFLRREFGVEVWATDLWFSPTERLARIRDAGVGDGVFPIYADARSLPFANGFFDVVVSIDSFSYFGTDDLYLSYLLRFLKPEGSLAIAGAGLAREVEEIPAHLKSGWEPAMACLHSAEWWRRHWSRSGLAQVEHADLMPDGWLYWLEWQRGVCPDNAAEIKALEADRGQTFGYVRAVARRKPAVALAEPIASVPVEYATYPMLREGSKPA